MALYYQLYIFKASSFKESKPILLIGNTIFVFVFQGVTECACLDVRVTVMTLSTLSKSPSLALVTSLDADNLSFRCVEVLEHVSLLPCYVGHLSEGIIKYLNQKIFNFLDQLGGILLAYSRPQVLQQYGAILDEQPHVHFDLKYSAYIFKPLAGSVLCGVVNNLGGDHIGCLVHNCFNASVVSEAAHKDDRVSDWSTDQIVVGSTIWFKVTNIENVGGVVSIGGEYIDLQSIRRKSLDLSSIRDESVPNPSLCEASIRHPKKRTHKKTGSSVDDIETKPKPRDKSRPKKRIRDVDNDISGTDLDSTDLVPKAKKAKYIEAQSLNSPRKQKKHKSNKS